MAAEAVRRVDLVAEVMKVVEVVAWAVAAALGYNSCTHRSRSNLTGHSTICRRDRTISHMYGAVGPCESSERDRSSEWE